LISKQLEGAHDARIQIDQDSNQIHRQFLPWSHTC